MEKNKQQVNSERVQGIVVENGFSPSRTLMSMFLQALQQLRAMKVRLEKNSKIVLSISVCEAAWQKAQGFVIFAFQEVNSAQLSSI